MHVRSLTVIAAALVLSGCDIPGSPVTVHLEEAQNSVASDIIYVDVTSASEIRLGENITSADKLVDDLKTELGDRKPADVRILIRPDRDVSYDDFVVVLEALQNAGYPRIGIIKAEQ